MKRNGLIAFIIISTLVHGLYSGEPVRPSIQTETYFRGTDNELTVFRNYGRLDGSTILLLGGIQGDEPGGYLSADLYADLPLEKGNLIVVPRANFLSIILNRRAIEKDMNRLFNLDRPPMSIEDSIVQTISGLMSEADLFLNLHDGYGFYSETWISNSRNPNRFGQSIIADADSYRVNGRVIDLKGIAERVVQGVNERILDPDHRMHFMNTRSFEADSRFREMVNSGTYHALVNFGIPAFGIESSKDLPTVEEKIQYHNLAINEFMDLFDVQPQVPGIRNTKVKLLFCHVSVNGAKAEVVYPGDVLELNRGDELEVKHISAGSGKGLSCDVLGAGTYQDFGKKVKLNNSTRIIFRKDSEEIGEVRIHVQRQPVSSAGISFIVKVNGIEKTLGHMDTLKVGRRDVFVLKDVLSSDFSPQEITVNMKGWVPQNPYNDGEDRGYSIPASDLVWKKYSLDGKGRRYPVVVTLNGEEISRLIIELSN